MSSQFSSVFDERLHEQLLGQTDPTATYGGEISRSDYIRMNPSSGSSSYSPGQQIIFQLGANHLIHNETLQLKYSIAADAAAWAFGDASQVIQGLRVESLSGAVIFDDSSYNSNILPWRLIMGSEDFLNSEWTMDSDYWNTATDMDLMPQIPTTAVTKTVRLSHPFFENAKFTHLMAFGGLRVIITLAKASDVLAARVATSGTMPTTYTVTNATLSYRALYMSPDYELLIDEMVRNNDLIYAFQDRREHRFLASGSGIDTVTVHDGYNSVERALVRFMLAEDTGAIVAYTNNPGTDTVKNASKWVNPDNSDASGTTTRTWQFRAGGAVIPQYAVDDDRSTFNILMSMVGRTADVTAGTSLTRANFAHPGAATTAASLFGTLNRYIIGIDLSRLPNSFGTGVNIQGSPLQFTSTVVGGTALGTTDNIIVQIEASRLVIPLGGGRITAYN